MGTGHPVLVGSDHVDTTTVPSSGDRLVGGASGRTNVEQSIIRRRRRQPLRGTYPGGTFALALRRWDGLSGSWLPNRSSASVRSGDSVDLAM